MNSREALQQFLNAPLPAHLVGRKRVPNFEGLDDENWAQLYHAYGSALDVPRLIRGLASPQPKLQLACLHQLNGNVIHQGTRYPSAVVVAKWVAHLLEYEAVPNKHLLLEYLACLMLGFPAHHLLVGCPSEFDDIETDQACYDEVGRPWLESGERGTWDLTMPQL